MTYLKLPPKIEVTDFLAMLRLQLDIASKSKGHTLNERAIKLIREYLVKSDNRNIDL